MDKSAASMHANFLRALLRLGSLTDRSAAERKGPWLLIDAGVEMDEFNLAVPADPVGDAAVELAEAAAWHANRGRLFRMVLREQTDAVLGAAAQSRGFRVSSREPSMLLEQLPSVPDVRAGLAIRQAVTPEDIDGYGRVDAPGMHEVTLGIARTAALFPDFVMLLGELNGVAIATSMAVVTGDLVGVYNVQVQPECRGRGFGRAMTAAAIRAGQTRGANQASLQATPLGEPLYRAMGFRTVYYYLELMATVQTS
jgi:ribosomal protein S18 acetylase RimI-like enzyme